MSELKYGPERQTHVLYYIAILVRIAIAYVRGVRAAPYTTSLACTSLFRIYDRLGVDYPAWISHEPCAMEEYDDVFCTDDDAALDESFSAGGGADTPVLTSTPDSGALTQDAVDYPPSSSSGFPSSSVSASAELSKKSKLWPMYESALLCPLYIHAFSCECFVAFLLPDVLVIYLHIRFHSCLLCLCVYVHYTNIT